MFIFIKNVVRLWIHQVYRKTGGQNFILIMIFASVDYLDTLCVQFAIWLQLAAWSPFVSYAYKNYIEQPHEIQIKQE